MTFTYLFSYEKYDEDLLLRSGVLELMRKHKVGIAYATQRKNYNEKLAEIIRFFNENKLFFVIWPLLSDEYGYWISTYNAKYLKKEVELILNWLQDNDIKVDGLIIDLEPPLGFFEKIKFTPKAAPQIYRALKRSKIWRKIFEDGISKFGEVIDLLHEHDVLVVAPCLDILFELEDFFREKVEMFLGTPIFEVEWDKISPMIYNSMAAGYYRIPISVLRFREYVILRKVRRLFGNRGAVVIGVIWTGKLGDEPVYSDPKELEIDAAIAKAVGIKNIGVFALEGVIFRKNDERWFEAVTRAEPRRPKIFPAVTAYATYRMGLKILQRFLSLAELA